MQINKFYGFYKLISHLISTSGRSNLNNEIYLHGQRTQEFCWRYFRSESNSWSESCIVDIPSTWCRCLNFHRCSVDSSICPVLCMWRCACIQVERIWSKVKLKLSYRAGFPELLQIFDKITRNVTHESKN